MQIQFLGTGAGMPSKARNTSAIALKLLDEIGAVWLFDCGEATQHQILHTNLKPRKIDKIFITHLHGDHIFGLPGFLSSRSFLGGDEPLVIFGPVGLEQFVRQSLAISGTHLTYELEFREIYEGVIFEDEHVIVKCQKLKHVVPCYGYRIEQKDLPGKLNIDEARKQGVPFGPLLGKLKAGEDVVLEDGKVVKSISLLSEPQKGWIVTILGDTKFCEASIELSENADVLIHEATFDRGTEKLAAQYGHSTNVEAATVAKRANVKYLLMNHISARFMRKDIELLESDARLVFEHSKIVSDFSLFQWTNNKLIQEEDMNVD